MSNKGKMVVFDFDGVIADSFDQLYKINRLSAQQIGKQLSISDYRDFFDGNIHKKITDFIGGDSRQKDKFLDYKSKIFSDFYNEKTVRLFDFSEKMIESLADFSELIIISSAPEELISKILKHKKLDIYFKNVFGINKNGKRETLLKQLDKNKDFYFITDTVGDILEVKGLNIKSFGITWGFHSEKKLLEAQPNYIINEYNELIRLISNF